MKTYFLLLGLCLTLSGCGSLFKMSEASHEREVARLNLIGSSFETAKAKATRAGFQCGGGENRDLGKNAIQCYKKSPELLCPQRRFLFIRADANNGKVISVGTRVVDNHCLGAA
ncbi:hypothetical protein NOF55_07095 [Rhizobiaceae bacterium BDR2-2]|uniref:Lipoprotein n=1 Tax=Ectorhizobium quercum TaxID=2965071 RepID=A0AAE3MYU6_9HYPH|nr:hypothetical protein [Ectorhizobium quercum]MCX8996867.1 hypothetical protein [Ectorhizobium quercum]